MREVLPRAAGGLLLAGVAFVLLVGALGPVALRHELADGGLACVFRSATGVVCPFCGMTHATLALGHGELGAAFAAHPLFPLVLGFVVWGAYRLVRGRPLEIAGRPLPLAAILAGTAVVWIVNLVAQSL